MQKQVREEELRLEEERVENHVEEEERVENPLGENEEMISKIQELNLNISERILRFFNTFSPTGGFFGANSRRNHSSWIF